MPEKKHEQVKREIISWIESGRLASGDRVPTENELVERFKVSKSPVRQALSDLSAEGYIYTVQGSGSYVTDLSTTLVHAPLTVHALFYTESDIEHEIMLGMHAQLRSRRDPSIRLAFQHPGVNADALIARLRLFAADSPEALVLIPVLGATRETNRRLASALRTLQDSGWMVMQLDHLVPELDGPAIMTDHRAGASLLADHLLDLGHERIAVLLTHVHRSSIRERLDGVRLAIERRGLTLPDTALLEFDETEVTANAREIVSRLDALDASAVISFENEGGAALLGVLEAAGRNVPEDLSLVTFDNRSFVRTHPNFVTHIRQPLYEIGARAMDVVLAELHARGSELRDPSVIERVAPNLVVGSSTCAPRVAAH